MRGAGCHQNKSGNVWAVTKPRPPSVLVDTNNLEDFARLASRAGASVAIKITTPSALVQAEQLDFLQEK